MQSTAVDFRWILGRQTINNGGKPTDIALAFVVAFGWTGLRTDIPHSAGKRGGSTPKLGSRYLELAFSDAVSSLLPITRQDPRMDDDQSKHPSCDPRHIPKCRTPSANRAREVTERGNRKVEHSKKNSRKQHSEKQFRNRKKDERMDELTSTGFHGYHKDINLDEANKFYKKKPVFFPFGPPDMVLYDNMDEAGVIHYMDEEKTIPGLILLPGRVARGGENKLLRQHKIGFLEHLQSVCKHTPRGDTKEGHSESGGIYTIFGVTVKQGRGLGTTAELRGSDDEELNWSKLENEESDEDKEGTADYDSKPAAKKQKTGTTKTTKKKKKKGKAKADNKGQPGQPKQPTQPSKTQLLKIAKMWVANLIHKVQAYLPRPEILKIGVAGEHIASQSEENFPKMAFSRDFFPVGGIASAVDYSAPAHIDKDFVLSLHQLNVEGREQDSAIAQYFCFPTLKLAVALRPGDILVFNPSVHHCLSAKSREYATDRVHVSTFYTRYGHVSLNNNNLELTNVKDGVPETVAIPWSSN